MGKPQCSVLNSDCPQNGVLNMQIMLLKNYQIKLDNWGKMW